MRIFHRIAAPLAALAMFAVPAVAQDGGAEQFLHTIYDQYKGEAGPPLDGGAMAHYFTPELAEKIDADAKQAKAKGEVPKVDGDPLIDAQDWKIDSLKIAAKEEGDRATGTVTFQNFGEPFEIRLDLRKTDAGWRIAEIYAPSGKLTEQLKR